MNPIQFFYKLWEHLPLTVAALWAVAFILTRVEFNFVISIEVSVEVLLITRSLIEWFGKRKKLH